MRPAKFNPETGMRQKLMTGVACLGNEESIFLCEYKTETTDCSNDDDAGVYCNFPGYKGCYDRGVCQKDRTNDKDMTIQKCLKHCRKNDMDYACLAGQDCECEIFILGDGLELDNWSCDEACGGDETQACGGTYKSAVYETTLGKCGREGITDEEGWIVSPEFPDNYPGWDDCNWYVEVGEGKMIDVTLRMLYLNKGMLFSDQVSFYNIDGKSDNKVKLTHNNNIKGVLDYWIGLTTANSLRVEFTSSRWYHDKGFAIFYKAFVPGECDNNICQNNGTCYEEDGEKMCVCREGWKGSTCEETSNMCLSNPCVNNGTCASISNGENDTFSCECPQGYDGYTCESRLTCESMSLCENNGSCKEENFSFFCECEPGYTGSFCENYMGTTEVILTTQLPVHVSTHTTRLSHQSPTTSQTGENYKDIAKSNIAVAVGTSIALTSAGIIITIVVVAVVCRERKRQEIQQVNYYDDARSPSFKESIYMEVGENKNAAPIHIGVQLGYGQREFHVDDKRYN